MGQWMRTTMTENTRSTKFQVTPKGRAMEETIYQRLACVKRTGIPFWIRPYESVLDVVETDTAITIKMRVADLIERSTGFEITRTGTRLIQFARDNDGYWTHNTITLWDEETDVSYIRTWGAGVTPVQYRERMSWAMDCFRPGSDRFPLDNADRTFEHVEYSTVGMKKHWKVSY